MECIEERSADTGWLAPAEHAGQGKLDLLGQARGLAEVRVPAARAAACTARAAARAARAAARTGRSTARRRRRAGDGGHACRSSARLADVTAVAALDLAEPAHQVHARADRAPVQLRGPVDRRLAGRADQHLAVGPDTALPGALAPVRVDLPCTTPIAGHEVCSDFCRSRRTRPSAG